MSVKIVAKSEGDNKVVQQLLIRLRTYDPFRGGYRPPVRRG